MATGWQDITVNDFGFEGRLQITQGGVAQDISDYTTLQYELKHFRATTTKTLEAQFLSDGTDGWLTRTFEDGDIDATGEWRVRAVVSKSGTPPAHLTSDWHKFRVDA